MSLERYKSKCPIIPLLTRSIQPTNLRRAFKSALPQTDDPYLNSPDQKTHSVEVFCTRHAWITFPSGDQH
ncbi:hypothetical protein J6590_053751 [Homalodisca vitripennis]|nr:hypothetical protein J6590_078242 [Homalodisca vitripennis]KAG8271837.1 hypothetical protein J6590_053751 [Homalodisca vitripennis]